jgi:antitoxin component HigA of HigAB toxin-antitoxin module
LSKIKPIRSEADYSTALSEVDRLRGCRSGTPEENRLDVLATLIDAYENECHPIDPADPIEMMPQNPYSPNSYEIGSNWVVKSPSEIPNVPKFPKGF